MEPKDVVVFDGENIRRTWIGDELWFAASDVVAAISGAKLPAAEKKEPEM